MNERRAAGLGALLLLAWLALGTAAHARAETAAPTARVVGPSTPLRSGPGEGFRVLREARAGEEFSVQERSSVGFWLRVRLPDATDAWIRGHDVFVFDAAVGEARPDRRALAPPPLPHAHGEVAIVFGALDDAGLMAVRPSWVLAPSFALELTAAAAVSQAGRTFLGGLGAVVNLFADSPVIPFVVGGGGLAYATPNADSFVLERGASSMLFAGGGLRLGFKYRVTLRIESRGVVLFTADQSVAQQEVSGGLTVFF